MAIIYNLVSSSASSTSKYGVQITTGAIVNQLPNASDTVQLQLAIDQVGVIIGSDHPSFSQYKCVDIDANHIGPNEVKITYTWEYRFPEVQIEVGSVSETEETNMDIYRNIITASYTFPDDYKWRPELAGDLDTRSVLVNRTIYRPTMTITRQETILGHQLQIIAAAFTGKLNRNPWPMVNPGSPRSWMCAGISGTSQDNGITYTVRYSFMHRSPVTMSDGTDRSGWDAEVIWIDPNTNNPPNPTEDNPVNPYDYKIYEDENFGDLDLL